MINPLPITLYQPTMWQKQHTSNLDPPIPITNPLHYLLPTNFWMTTIPTMQQITLYQPIPVTSNQLHTHLKKTTPYLPEPLNLLGISCIVPIHRVLFPFASIQFLHATQHQLQLLLVKELQPLQRHYLVEAVQEGLGLLLNASLESPLHH